MPQFHICYNFNRFVISIDKYEIRYEAIIRLAVKKLIKK
jgi:hypothetical protein